MKLAYSKYSVGYGVQKFKTRAAMILMAAGVAVGGTGLAFVTIGTSSAAPSPAESVVYNSIPNPLPGGLTSLGFEATSTSEFGAQLKLAGNARTNPMVNVVLDSYACKSGSYQASCITNPGSTFTEPVTLNVYSVSTTNEPGALLTSKTKTFTIPYRPTADDGTNCNGANAGRWWDGHACYTNKAYVAQFDLSGVTLPDNVIVSVAYNTTHHGSSPYGETTSCFAANNCPYDSLNVGLSSAITTGSVQPTAFDAYLNSTWNGAYCDSTLATGIFRLDEGCWSSTGDNTGTPLTPAIKVSAAKSNSKPSKPLPWWRPPVYPHYSGHGHKHSSGFWWL